MAESTKQRSSRQGFSLVEVVLTFAILAVATIALGLVELSNARRTQDLKERDISFARGQAFMERILRMPFGAPNPSAMTAGDYDVLFGSDEDVRSVSLTQLEQKDNDGDGRIDSGPIRFQLEGVEDSGVWEVFVDGGPTLKRIRPQPMGRAFRILKRQSHITIKLDTRKGD